MHITKTMLFFLSNDLVFFLSNVKLFVDFEDSCNTNEVIFFSLNPAYIPPFAQKLTKNGIKKLTNKLLRRKKNIHFEEGINKITPKN